MSEYVVDFRTLGFLVADWVEAHCVVPDRSIMGAPFTMYDWQLWCTVNHYRVKPEAQVGQLGTAFHYRRSQIVGPQKTGKGPWAATIVTAEGVGPVLFSGWAGKDDGYACADHGCPCGWEYAYDKGDPMGVPWPTPLIQLLATAEDQVDNIFRPLQMMIKRGPLGDVMKVGEEFIRLPNDGRIDVVTSSHTARLGQPVTFAVQDESGLYTQQNKMVRVAETQRRGAAGMSGRTMETTNAWDPSEQSVAQRTAESKVEDIFRFHRVPPPNLSYANKKDRARIHRIVYEGCEHIDLDAIEAEAAELMERDPAQAERFFGNRIVAGAGKAVDPHRWKELARPDGRPEPGTYIGLGFDGSISEDCTVLRGCTADGYSFLLGAWVRPKGPRGKNWRVPRIKVDQAVRDAFATYEVGRMNCDPAKWWTEIEGWAEEFGEEVVLFFDTNQDRRMAPAVDRWLVAIAEGTHTHDDDPMTNEHVGNAPKRKARAKDPDDDSRTLYTLTKPMDGGKIDAAVADVLAHEAAMTMPEQEKELEPMVAWS